MGPLQGQRRPLREGRRLPVERRGNFPLVGLGGRPSHLPSLAIREAPPLAPYWPQRDGMGRLRPAPTPPTGHLKPTWPSEAFGHLHPHSPHRAIGTPSDGEASPPPTYWPPTGHPRPSPTPQTFGSGGLREGAGLFACKGCRSAGARATQTPFGDPIALYPHLPTYPTGLPASPSAHPHRLDGERGVTDHLRPTPG